MADTIIITQPAERRQIAKSIGPIPFEIACAVDWNKIELTARELGANFEARRNRDQSLTITFFWSYTDEELR